MASVPESAAIEDLLVEWEDRWLASLKSQVYELHHRRQLHAEFMEMLRSQDHPDTDVFAEAFDRMYVESQAMAIRRQADNHPRTLSLRRLIGQLQQHRKKFTRAWYVGRWMAERQVDSLDERQRREARFHLQLANEAFDQFTDKAGGLFLGARRLSEDRHHLEAMTEAVERYANETVAHIASDSSREPVTYTEFNRAIDHLGGLLKRYYLLINQGGLVNSTPVIQGDWKGPFRKPLA